MAFPTTPILDNCERANEGPPPSASWVNDPEGWGSDGFVIASQRFSSFAGFPQAGWAPSGADQYGPDCESRIQITTIPTVDTHAIALQLRASGTGAGRDGYQLAWKRLTAATDELYIQVYTNAVFTTLGSVFQLEMTNDAWMGFEIIGTTLKGYTSTDGTSWTERISRTDSTYTNAGRMEMYADRWGTPVTLLKNFGGGTIVGSQVGQYVTARVGEGSAW